MSVNRLICIRDVAESCGGRMHPALAPGDRPLRTVATLRDAEPDTVSWVSDAKHAKLLAACRAAAIVGPAALLASDPRGIIVEDADLAMTRVLALFLPARSEPPRGIHPTAIVDSTARVAPGAAIGPLCVIQPGAKIGEDCILHEGVSIGRNVHIGRGSRLHPRCVVQDECVLGQRVILHSGVVVGADGFGYIFRAGEHIRMPHIGTVIIEDDVEIGPNTVVDRAKIGATTIGRGTKIDALVMIAHNVQIGRACILVAQAGLSGSVRLGTGVVLGGQAGIADNARLANGVRVGAQSGVLSDITEAGRSLFGTPAQDLRDTLKAAARLRKLPGLFEHFAALSRRVTKLEAAADHRKHD